MLQTIKLNAMKKTITLFLFTALILNKIYSQTPLSDYLDINNVKALYHANGTLFWDYTSAKFEVPKKSDSYTIFASELWIGGYDAGNNLKIAAQTYRQTGNDFYPGPLDTTGTTNPTVMAAYNKVWKINKCSIDSFTTFCQTGLPVGYQTPSVIKTWPGISSFGSPLAPFYDANNDGLYNSDSCDYPLIKGDQAIFFVFNDAGGVHGETGGGMMHLEIQAMVYAYSCKDSALYNTVFSNYKVINKGSMNIDSTYFGHFVDFDLGSYNDDYVGCDVSRGAFYVYNGDAVDGPMVNGSGNPFGAHPPAQGVVFLRGPFADPNNEDDSLSVSPNGYGYGDGIKDNEKLGLTNFIYYDNNQNPINGNPTVADDYYQYLSSSWRNGQPVTYGGNGVGGTLNAHYMFPANSDPLGYGTNMVPQAAWDETTVSNTPGDRRGVGASGPYTMQAGSVNEIDLAYVFGRDYTGTNITSIATMQTRIDSIRSKFNKGITGCGCPSGPNGISSLSKENIFSFFPNPASSELTIVYTGSAKEYQIKIFDVTGKLVKQMENISSDKIIIPISELNKGMYLLNIHDGENISTKRFVKQ